MPARSVALGAMVHWSGDVAQLGEHLLCKQGVVGSNPIVSTIGWGWVRGCCGEDVRVSGLSWFRPPLGGGVLADLGARSRFGARGFLFFVRVNQVLVRLWACLVAMSDRWVGCGRVIGCVWLPATGLMFRGVSVVC